MTIFTVTSCRTSSTSVEIWQNGYYNVAKPSRMLFWQFRGHVTQPIGRYVHICTDSKKNFVRGVVRGIYFEKSLRERLSPEGGQNWHDLTLHKCSNTCKSNQNTSLTQPYGRKQRLLAKSPLVLNHIPCYTTFKTAFGDRLEVKIGKRPCNHPLNYFRQLVLVKFRTQKITEMPYFDALARHLSRYLFFILPKYPLPAPTCRPFLIKRLNILNFC